MQYSALCSVPIDFFSALLRRDLPSLVRGFHTFSSKQKFQKFNAKDLVSPSKDLYLR